MKTKEISLTNDWTFSRFMRISFKLAFIYSVLSAICILIFGNNPEISWKIRIEHDIIKELQFTLNSWISLFIDLGGIILLGALAYCIYRVLPFLKDFDPDPQDNLSGYLWLLLIVGLIISFVFS